MGLCTRPVQSAVVSSRSWPPYWISQLYTFPLHLVRLYYIYADDLDYIMNWAKCFSQQSIYAQNGVIVLTMALIFRDK